MPEPCTHCHRVPASGRVPIMVRDPAGYQRMGQVNVAVCDCDRLRCPACKRSIGDARKDLACCPRCDAPLPNWPTFQRPMF